MSFPTIPSFASFKSENSLVNINDDSFPLSNDNSSLPILTTGVGSFGSSGFGGDSAQFGNTALNIDFDSQTSPFAYATADQDTLLNGEEPLVLAANDYTNLLLPDGVIQVQDGSERNGYTRVITQTNLPVKLGSRDYNTTDKNGIPPHIVESMERALARFQPTPILKLQLLKTSFEFQVGDITRLSEEDPIVKVFPSDGKSGGHFSSEKDNAFKVVIPDGIGQSLGPIDDQALIHNYGKNAQGDLTIRSMDAFAHRLFEGALTGLTTKYDYPEVEPDLIKQQRARGIENGIDQQLRHHHHH